MRTRQSRPTPDWKAIILAGPDWPEDLTIPQTDQLPEDSKCIQASVFTNEHWDWELWRHPDGHYYYLKVWPTDKGDFGKPNTPGATLSVTETFQFLMSNWMPRDVLADLAFERSHPLRSFDLPPGTPDLN